MRHLKPKLKFGLFAVCTMGVLLTPLSYSKNFKAKDLLSDDLKHIIVLDSKPSCEGKKTTAYFNYKSKSDVSREEVSLFMLKKKAKKRGHKAIRMKEIVKTNEEVGHNTHAKGYTYDCTK